MRAADHRDRVINVPRWAPEPGLRGVRGRAPRHQGPPRAHLGDAPGHEGGEQRLVDGRELLLDTNAVQVPQRLRRGVPRCVEAAPDQRQDAGGPRRRRNDARLEEGLGGGLGLRRAQRLLEALREDAREERDEPPRGSDAPPASTAGPAQRNVTSSLCVYAATTPRPLCRKWRIVAAAALTKAPWTAPSYGFATPYLLDHFVKSTPSTRTQKLRQVAS